MTVIQGLALGLLQGLTEFLPVSSSGHLVIAQKLLGFSHPPVQFDIFVHLATSLAVIIVMWPVLISLKKTSLIQIIIASLPAAIIGLSLNSRIEVIFNSLSLVGLALLITASLLFLSYKFYPQAKKSNFNLKDAFFIGAFQALAIIPGISRSGSTIVAGLFKGLSPQVAFNFSFLLSLPAVLGAQLLHLPALLQPNLNNAPFLLAGFTSAFFSGLFALILLKKLVTSKKLGIFGYYCLALGLLVLVLPTLF